MDDRASFVTDCSSSPTADTIWSLMVSARVWLTCWAVRHHNRCTPTALTTMDVRTRAEMALRMPRRMQVSWFAAWSTAVRNHSSVCFSGEAVSGVRTQICDRSWAIAPAKLTDCLFRTSQEGAMPCRNLEGHAMHDVSI